MQGTFGINTVALVDGQPRLLNLKNTRGVPASPARGGDAAYGVRTEDLLRRANRAHILEGSGGGARQHGRDDRADQGAPTIRPSQNPDDGAYLEVRTRGRTCWRERQLDVNPPGPGAGLREFGLAGKKKRLQDFGCPGAGHSSICDLHRLTGLEQGEAASANSAGPE